MTQLLEVGTPAHERLIQEAVTTATKIATELTMKMMKQEDWISADQAMKMLNCERTFFLGLLEKKLITRSKISPRISLYSRKSILSYIEDNIQK